MTSRTDTDAPQTEDSDFDDLSSRDQLIADLQKDLQKAQDDLTSVKEDMLRVAADAENTRRRARLDIENAHKFGSEKFAKELLHIVDSFEHGMNIAIGSDEPQVKAIHDGMELTYKMFLDTLQKFNIEQLNPVGEEFDPQRHEALTTQPTDEAKPNTVLTVVQRGFTMYDRVLRPARVIVARELEK